VLVAGCGSSSKAAKPNNEASKPADQVFADAKAAATSASSAHVSGKLVSNGTAITLDLSMARDKGAKGSVSINGLGFDLVKIGDTAYIKGSDAFYQHFAGPAVAQLIHGKWIKAPTTSKQFRSFAALASVSGLFAEIGANHGKLVNDGKTTYKGQPVVAIRDLSDDSKLYVAATGKPLVVVLQNGSALAINWAQENANAILEAWYSGEEGGSAIAESLAGVNNPAGRLPVTFYKGVEQLPPFDDYSMKNRTYRYFEGQPLYPFGYGLSYSKFAYSSLKLSATTLKAGDSLSVDADVKNASEREGDEVVQLYLSFPKSPGAPLRALRGMTRVHLAAGESKHVQFTLDARDLSGVNSNGDRIVAAGSHHLYVGGGQPGTEAPGVEAEFSVGSEQRLPE
jgi:beta-glucosidase